MKKLTGSEKQVTWAEDIRKRYQHLLKEMEAVLPILADTSTRTTIVKDIINKTEKPVTKYLKNPTMNQYAVQETVERFLGITTREKKWDILGKFTGDARTKELKYWTFLTEALKNAIDTQHDAKYWIDRR